MAKASLSKYVTAKLGGRFATLLALNLLNFGYLGQGKEFEKMAAKSELSIRAAVMHCWARCAESQAPLCTLGEFLEKLVSMGWSAADVRSVETIVLRLLGRMRETEKSIAESRSSAEAESLLNDQTGR